MRVLVTSEKDIASQTIKTVLIEEYGFLPTGDNFEENPILAANESTILITTKQDMIFCDHLEDHFDAEAFIFCSRHRAESAKPALLVHSTGNLGPEALFGGNPQQVSVSAPSLVSVALQSLYKERQERGLNEFDVSLEVTHHGPTSMTTPLVFIELGSNEEYWVHKDAARAVAAAIMECTKEPIGGESVIGFGGTHYASKFNKLVLEKGYKMGHMAPKYAVNELTLDVVKQMVSRTTGYVSKAIVDWKGMNAENKAYIFPILEEAGLEIVRDKSA
ncbi:MAG: D-aminoacyl-tRNA deacylase [Candidatus Thorarchaeota archaeon]